VSARNTLKLAFSLPAFVGIPTILGLLLAYVAELQDELGFQDAFSILGVVVVGPVQVNSSADHTSESAADYGV
jgi:hypothetical protein